MALGVTPEGIEAAIKALNCTPDREILKYLALVLKPSESIYAYTSVLEDVQVKIKGQKDFSSSRRCKAVLTQKRLILASKGWGLDFRETTIQLSRVREVKTKGWLLPKVILLNGKRAISLTIEKPGNAEDFSKFLRQFVFGPPPEDIPNLGWYSTSDIKIKILQPAARQPIPRSVQKLVWERDGGQCVNCGRKSDLQFDHIIPVSRGGNNSAENLQILCRACNLGKSNRIGG